MATIVRGKNPNKPYTVRYYHDGRQRERSFATRKEANDFRVKFEHDVRDQTFVDPKIAGEKFGAVAGRWLARHPGSPRTLENYETNLRRHILPVFGERRLAEVAADRESAETFLRYVLPGKGLGPSVVASCYMILKAIINDSVKGGRLGPNSNRLKGIAIPAVAAKAELVFASTEQIIKMALAMPAPYGFSIILMRGCGLRLGEALGVQADDFFDGTLRLARQLAPKGDNHLPLKHRRDGDYRDIPVPKYVADSRPGDFSQFPAVDHRAYRAWFNRARDEAGLSRAFTPHALRHIFASACLAGGIPITDVSKWLGHRDINVTFAIYGHLVPASWDRARGVLDAEWNG